MTGFVGYRSLLGPEQLLIAPGQRVSTPAEYRGWQTLVVTQRAGKPWESPEPTVAYVNHGRWVATCCGCKNGMLTRPDWGVAFCGECGASYGRGKVEFPADAAAIEAVLCRRVRRDQQHWDARQSVRDLERENETPECVTP